MTAVLAQRVLDAISIDMVVRAPKRENQSGNALFHARGRFPVIAQSEGRVWREVYNFSLARGRSHKVSRTSPRAIVGFKEKYSALK